MQKAEFRLATEADLPAIRDILNQAIRRGGCNAFTAEVDLEDRRNWLAQHPADRFPVYVVEVDSQVVGWLSFSGYRTARTALSGLTEIAYYLHEEWQGRGLGKQLLQYLIQEGRRRGFEHLLAVLLDTNTPSVRVLEHAGFTRWGHLPDIAQLGEYRAGQFYYGLDLRR